jgi:2-polyprenyl-6-methoxyphenol hydroxylase-like FAD-dependent oxidoreductase
MGLWDEFERVPQVALERVELYVNGRLGARVAFEATAFGRFAPRWVSQPGFLEMMVARAGAFPCFRLARGATARGLVEEAGRVVGVRVLDDAGERELRADLVVGADGRSSMVRRRAGFPERADPTPIDVVWCKVPLPDWARTEKPFRGYLGHGHLLLAAPVYDDKLQMGWVIRKGSFGELKEHGMPVLLEEMARHVSPDLASHLRRHAHEAVEPFLLSTVSDRVLTWSRPGVLLMGDAAHTMSPVGAQGLNIALRDALVAANHLVPVLEGGAKPEALDTAARAVEAERKPEIEAIQRLQAIGPRIVLSTSWWSGLVLRVLPILARSELLRGRQGRVLRRFAFGVTEVKLAV